ncbi:hypothetical protein [uncultured Pontibacter sp.]|uniref:hypothetical protein n=1 Tax=uncultured Pontibacter sp. TaxID=453356 RepID=UPI00260B8D17|nr:hypothetical protein [uncultured Pontibacter sp.]
MTNRLAYPTSIISKASSIIAKAMFRKVNKLRFMVEALVSGNSSYRYNNVFGNTWDLC